MMGPVRYTALAAVCALVGCRGGAPAEVVEEPGADQVVAAPQEPPRPTPMLRPDGTRVPELERATTDVFGLPVPRGTTMLEQGDGVRHLRTRASLDELIGFFDANTPGGITVEHFERGARFVPRDAEGRAVYAYYDQTPAVFTLSYVDTLGRYGGSASSSADATGSAATAAAPAAGSTGGDRIVPAQSTDAQRASRPAAAEAEFLREQMGQQIPVDDVSSHLPAPVVSPVSGGGFSDEGPARSYRPPLRFVRGVREPRQNPDAMF